MVITSSLLFHLLANRYAVVIHHQGTDNIPIRTPKLLRNLKTAESLTSSPGFYICEGIDFLSKFSQPESVFLIIGKSVDFLLPPGCDAAFIETDLSLDSLMYEICEIFRELQDWDLALKEASLERTNLSRMMTVVQQFFPELPSVVDRNYIVHGSSSYWATQGIIKDYTLIDGTKLKTPFSTINELLLDPEFVASLQKEDVFVYHANQPDACLCLNIFAREQFLARIITPLSRPLTPGLMYLFKHVSQYIQFIFLNYTDDVIVKRQNDKMHLLLSDLLDNPETVNPKRLVETLENYGWSTAHHYDVTIFRFDNLDELNHIYLYFCNQLEMEWLHSYAFKSEQEIVWVVNNDLCHHQPNGRSRRQSLSYLIRDLLCRAGVSNPFSDLTQLPHYYRQAVFAHEKNTQKNPHFWYAHFRDYTLDYIMELLKTDLDQHKLYHSGTLKLIEYDHTTGSALTNVLYTFITSNFNVTTASDKLFMHRSTFNRQMKKIKELTMIDWHNETNLDELIHVLISLRQLSSN